MDAPGGFVDLHIHLLPDLDDGPANLDQAVALARAGLHDGIVQAAATCHQCGHFAHNHADNIRDAARKLIERLKSDGVELAIRPSAEWMLDAKMIDEWATLQADLLTLGDGGKYALIEFPQRFPAYITRVSELLAQRQVHGVLAHVEKYADLLAHPKRLAELHEMGFVAQMNADSIAGRWGTKVAKQCRSLIRKGWIHVVASDAHSVERRPPLLREAFSIVTQWTNAETADLLFRQNPSAVLAGEEVQQPRPAGWLGRWKA